VNLELYEKYCPRPFYSGVVDGCIESGKESRKWVYPSMIHHFAQVIGGTNVADSITAVRKVVFEDKRVTLPELIKIMDKNWEGRRISGRRVLPLPNSGMMMIMRIPSPGKYSAGERKPWK